MEMEMAPLIERDEGESSRPYSPCIFRIAHPLLTLKPEAYTPQVISMGPFHHKRSPNYEETESYKHQTMRIMESKFGFTLDSLVTQIKKKNPDTQIRAFYDRNLPGNDDCLWRMLVLDASFLLQWLRPNCAFNSAEEKVMMQLMGRETILHWKRKTPLWYAIQSDIFMLENQVPQFLLTELLQLTPLKKSEEGVVQKSGEGDVEKLQGILSFVCSTVNPFPREKDSADLFEPLIGSFSHILDFLYLLINAEASSTPGIDDQKKNDYLIFARILGFLLGISSTATGGSLPSAAELHGAGVKFERCSSGHMRDIHFNGKSKTLCMPKIIIRDSTEVVLRNLLAFELYLGTNRNAIAGYTYLMDRLIDTPQDVAVLKRFGILESQIGSDDAIAKMWNSICRSIPENSFEPVNRALRETEKYYRNKWRVLLAEFVKVHCSKPWVILSVIAAVMLFLLTFMQVFCAFYTCNKSSNTN